MERPEDGDSTAFAPLNPTDGRLPYEWQTKYPAEAISAIRVEAIYLALLLFIAPALIFVLWLGSPRTFLGISDQKYPVLVRFGVAWLSGMIGGTLFDLKWLYHSVAKGSWHLDRRLWRLFTPHISAGLAFCVTALISSGFIRIFDAGAVQSSSMTVGVSFLIGYFSDSAIAKLSEIADTLFGESRARIKRQQSNPEQSLGPGPRVG